MSNIVLKVQNSQQMEELGYIITLLTFPNMVLALDGDLGAGKTTFTKGVGKALGIKKIINSPTFTIMKIYDVENKINNIEKLYHLDVYRIDNINNDFELEEYFYQNGLTVIEWANIIKEILPSNALKIWISYTSQSYRIVEISNCNSIYKALINKIEENKYEVIN